MIELNKIETEEILKISEKFIDIHREIMIVEETIKNMEDRSADLIKELEECRDKDRRFRDYLCDKYGEGDLDVSGLKWKQCNEFQSIEIKN